MSEYNIRIEIEKQENTFMTTLIDLDLDNIFAQYECEDPDAYIDTNEVLTHIRKYVEEYDGKIRYVGDFEDEIMLILDFKDEDDIVVAEIQFTPDKFIDIEFYDLTGHESAMRIDDGDVILENFTGQTMIIEDRIPFDVGDVYEYIIKNVFGYEDEPSDDDEIREWFKMEDDDYNDLKNRRPSGKVWTDDNGIEYITVEGWC